MTAIAVPKRAPNVLAVAAGAAFLALLDTTVANLAVADVRTDFTGASTTGATWIITLAALLATDIASFKDVYLFCTLGVAGAAVFGRPQ